MIYKYELLSAVGKLTAEYGEIGGNLNQIARCLNEYGAPYNALSQEVRAANNLVQNSIHSNPEGCTIILALQTAENESPTRTTLLFCAIYVPFTSAGRMNA